MTDVRPYRAILKRVGTVLIIVGLADIALSVYAIVNNLSYNSGFNIVAIIIGILLIRGGLRTAKFVTSAAAFFLVVSGWMLVMLLVAIIQQSIDLSTASWPALFSVGLLGIFYWIYSQLRLEPVLQTRREAGLTDKPPVVAFAVGLLLPVIAATMMFMIVNRDGPYKDLEAAFPGDSSSASKSAVATNVVLTSNKHLGAFSYTRIMRVGLSDDFLEIDPQFPLSYALRKVQIPKDSISGCSKTCGGRWSADLLIESTGTEISIDGSQETLEWCWNQQIPMISGKDRRECLVGYLGSASIPYL